MTPRRYLHLLHSTRAPRGVRISGLDDRLRVQAQGEKNAYVRNSSLVSMITDPVRSPSQCLAQVKDPKVPY
jgi:hypothetical protein